MLTLAGILKPRPSVTEPPLTDYSVLKAKADMYAERIAAGVCPICEPVRPMDQFGFCGNPYCAFAAFAGPFAAGSIMDPRR